MLRHRKFDFLLGTRKSLGIWFIDWDLELLLKVAFNSLFSCEIVREGPLEKCIWQFGYSSYLISMWASQLIRAKPFYYCASVIDLVIWIKDVSGAGNFISVQSIRDIHSLSLAKSKNIGLNYFLSIDELTYGYTFELYATLSCNLTFYPKVFMTY